jgi:hypothetical protein
MAAPVSLPAPPRLLLATRTVPSAPAIGPLRDDVLKAETQTRDIRASLASLLQQGDEGEARLVNVVVDDLGPASLGLVDEAIDGTPRVRPKHAKIHVVQGVEIDRKHPGKACVYVLVMDEFEYAGFRRRLDERLPGSTTDPVAAPVHTLASLPSVGRIEIYDTKKPAGTLMPPDIPGNGRLALRPSKVEEQRGSIIDPRSGQPQVVEVTPAKPADPDPKDSVKVANKPGTPTRSVFLVVVTPRDRSRD